MNELRKESEKVIQDLLTERSLWTIYLTSRRIPFSLFNNGAGVIVGVLCAIQAVGIENEAALNQISSLAMLVFNTTVSLLGFLLAGFTFFATVADKSLFCRMAGMQHESGLSYLKYNLFLFLRVFVEFLILCIFSLLVIFFLSDGTGVRLLLSDAKKQNLLPPAMSYAFVTILTGLLSGTFVYSLMQLKSFIFNIYHVVMTSIAWEVQKTAEEADVISEIQSEKE